MFFNMKDRVCIYNICSSTSIISRQSTFLFHTFFILITVCVFFSVKTIHCFMFQSQDNPNTAEFVAHMNHLKSQDRFTQILFSSFVRKVRYLRLDTHLLINVDSTLT